MTYRELKYKLRSLVEEAKQSSIKDLEPTFNTTLMKYGLQIYLDLFYESELDAAIPKKLESKVKNFLCEYDAIKNDLEMRECIEKYGKESQYSSFFALYDNAQDVERVINSPDGIILDALSARMQYHIDKIEYIRDINSIAYTDKTELSNIKLHHLDFNALDYIIISLIIELEELFKSNNNIAHSIINRSIAVFGESLPKIYLDILFNVNDTDRYYELLTAGDYINIHNILLPDYKKLIDSKSGKELQSVWPFNNNIAHLILTQLSHFNFTPETIKKMGLIGVDKYHGLYIEEAILYEIIKEIVIEIQKESGRKE